MAKVKIKSRKERLSEYVDKYKDIPYDSADKINYIIKENKISDKELESILAAGEEIKKKIKYKTLGIILYEEPIPYMRGRVGFGKTIYTPLAQENSNYMKEFIKNFIDNFKMIITPIDLDLKFYIPTPKTFNKKEKVLSELGIIRPTSDPDFDNIAKGYCDMSNMNLFYDDALIRSGKSSKFYSIRPRVEIELTYQNIYECDKQLKKLFKSDRFINTVPDGIDLEVLMDLVKDGDYYTEETNTRRGLNEEEFIK